MTRVRRVRWIAIAVVAMTAIGTLVVGAQAYADRDDSRCVRSPQATIIAQHGQPAQHESWRTGALRAMGCRAWRHMHHPRRSFVRLGR
jgi:hypothetical protein